MSKYNDTNDKELCKLLLNLLYRNTINATLFAPNYMSFWLY
jgi:hypothetical protein